MQASQQAPVAERRDDLMREAAAFSAAAEQAASSGETNSQPVRFCALWIVSVGLEVLAHK